MSIRKALVLDDSGNVQQLQAGDSLGIELDQYPATTDSAMIAGQIVRVSTASHVAKAQANTVANASVLGLVTAAPSSGGTAYVQTNGILSLTTGEWDALMGTTGGLTPQTVYWLSGTAGLGTSTRPTSGVLMRIGKALSSTDLEILRGEPILL